MDGKANFDELYHRGQERLLAATSLDQEGKSELARPLYLEVFSLPFAASSFFKVTF